MWGGATQPKSQEQRWRRRASQLGKRPELRILLLCLAAPVAAGPVGRAGCDGMLYVEVDRHHLVGRIASVHTHQRRDVGIVASDGDPHVALVGAISISRIEAGPSFLR